MIGSLFFKSFPLLCCAFLLAGCQASGTPVAQQRLVEWPEANRLFVADERTGQVRAFYLGHGSPVPVAQTAYGARRSVHALRLDAESRTLWVFGDNGAEAYDADRLAPQAPAALARLSLPRAAVTEARSPGASEADK